MDFELSTNITKRINFIHCYALLINLIMEIYLVMVDTNGAHEADCLYSVWNNKKDAEKEVKRLNKSGMSLGCYGGKAGIQVIEINKSYDIFQDLP